MARRDVQRVNGELFIFTYGSLVAQLVEDYEEDEDINQQLDKMGYSMGERLVDDFLAHASRDQRCRSFSDVCNVVANEGFKSYLGTTGTLVNWSADKLECSLILDDNPLTTFAELPENHQNLHFSQMIAGALRGVFEMVQYRIEARFVQDSLQGDNTTEIRLKVIEKLDDMPPKDED